MAQITYTVILSVEETAVVKRTVYDAETAIKAVVWATGVVHQLFSPTPPVADDGSLVKTALEQITGSEAAPICGVHNVPMRRVEGKKGPFWSCHQRNPDGSYCSYRPPRS